MPPKLELELNRIRTSTLHAPDPIPPKLVSRKLAQDRPLTMYVVFVTALRRILVFRIMPQLSYIDEDEGEDEQRDATEVRRLTSVTKGR